MKRIAVFGLSLLILMSMFVSPALAQDDEMAILEVGEVITISYPADWLAEVDVAQGGIVIVNGESAREAMENTEEDAGPGEEDFAILITFLPAEFLAIMGVEITEETTVEEVANLIATAMVGDGSDESAPEIGETSTVTLGEDDEEVEVGAVEITSDTLSGKLVTWIVEDTVVLVVLAGHPDTYADFEETGLEILSTLEVSGTGEEIQ
ncbi:MAG TPA: hypothetical protein VJZ27_03625, partial [Aggregatilineales bacterium]|nr:hypothetical protein [Aggregatilineales bacterium]